MGRHTGDLEDDWHERCNDADEWLAGIRDSDRTEEPTEVKSLIQILLDRRVLSRLKKIRTSLREKDHE